MSIPTIAMIPSGYKASKIYSVLPTNGDADLAFTRASEATRVNQNGIIETVGVNVPRLDHSDGGCPSLLVEPQSTNLVTYSEDFSDASWVKTRATITSNVDVSPKGDLTASRLYDSAVNNTHFIRATLSINAINNSRFIFAKKGTFSHIQVSEIEKRDISNGYAIFDLENGVVVQSVTFTAEIVDFGNGWYKCILKGSTYNIFDISILNSGGTGLNDNLYLGTGTDYISIWGAQLEELPYASSYIPTNGTAVTRAAETTSKTGLQNYINSSELVFYTEISAKTNTNIVNRIISLHDNTVTSENYIQLRVDANDNILLRIFKDSLPIGSAISTTSITADTFYKVAFKISASGHSLFVNGVKIGENLLDSSFPVNTLNTLSFSNNIGTSEFLGKCRDLRVYNQALTDAELITLTT